MAQLRDLDTAGARPPLSSIFTEDSISWSKWKTKAEFFWRLYYNFFLSFRSLQPNLSPQAVRSCIYLVQVSQHKSGSGNTSLSKKISNITKMLCVCFILSIRGISRKCHKVAKFVAFTFNAACLLTSNEILIDWSKTEFRLINNGSESGGGQCSLTLSTFDYNSFHSCVVHAKCKMANTSATGSHHAAIISVSGLYCDTAQVKPNLACETLHVSSRRTYVISAAMPSRAMRVTCRVAWCMLVSLSHCHKG